MAVSCGMHERNGDKMNGILLIIPVLLPIMGGMLLPLFPFNSRRQRNIYVETIVVINSLLMWYLLVTHPMSYTRLINLAGILEVSVHLDGTGMVFAALVATLWPFATLYAFEYMKHEGSETRFFSFYTITYGITLGIALSANLMTMYMFYEMLTLVTIPLVMHSFKKEARFAGRKYAYYSIGGAAFAFIGFIFILNYGSSMNFTFGGVLDTAKIGADTNVLLAVFVFMVLGFGVKAAIFPLHGWLPTASIAPTPVTALLHAVAVVKSGAFAIIRITYYIFGTEFLRGTWAQYTVLLFVAATILYCSSSAVKEQHLKRRFAYSTSSNLSYILLGVLLMTPGGLVGGFTHMIFHGIMKITLFFAVGAIMHQTGSTYIYEISGYGKKMPVVFACLSIAGIALIGIPPLTGFISKWNIATAAVGAWQQGNRLAPVLICVLILSAFLTSIYIFTIIIKAYLPAKFTPTPSGQALSDKQAEGSTREICDPNWLMKLPMVLFAILIFLFGIYSAPLMNFFSQVASGRI